MTNRVLSRLDQRTLTRGGCIIAAVFLVLSCFTPAIDTCDPDGSVRDTGTYGWEWLTMGWAGPIAGIFGWFANPLLLHSLARLASGKLPNIFISLVAILLAISSIAFQQTFTLPFDDIHALHLCHPRIGFTCWILALCVPLLLSLLSIESVRRLIEPKI